MSKKLPIFVEPDSPINIKAQIAGQIKSLIALNELKSGDTLPTVVELAEQLDVNHNTVAAVYNDLKKSGYLSAQRGKGTFVTNNEIVKKSRNNQPIYTLLDKAFNLADQFGLSRTEFSLAADSLAAFSYHTVATPLRVVFVATTARYEKDIYEAIKKEIEIPLEFFTWSENKAENRETLFELKVADMVITTPLLFSNVVKGMTPDIEVCNIGAKLEHKPWKEVSSLLDREMLLLVAENKAESEAMKDLLERDISESSNLQVTLKAIDKKEFEQNPEIFNQAKIICVSPVVENYVRQQREAFYASRQTFCLQEAEPVARVEVLNFCPDAYKVSLLANRLAVIQSSKTTVSD